MSQKMTVIDGAADAGHQHLKVLLVLNLVIMALELCGFVEAAADRGLALFCMYTEDSNILNLVACAIFSVCAIRELKRGEAVPGWAHVLSYVGMCCLSLTFLVVIFVLAPMMENGYQTMLLSGSMLFNHLLCPLVTFAAFLYDRSHLDRSALKWACIPTLVYGVTLIVLNLLHVVEGPYPFLRVWNQPWWMSVIWVVLILGGAYLICRGLLALRGRLSRHAAGLTLH